MLQTTKPPAVDFLDLVNELDRLTGVAAVLATAILGLEGVNQVANDAVNALAPEGELHPALRKAVQS